LTGADGGPIQVQSIQVDAGELSPDARDALRAALREAVLAEREACALLAEPSAEHRRDASWGYIGGGGAEGVELLDAAAAAIRARGEA
jgi:hypothetical protein